MIKRLIAIGLMIFSTACKISVPFENSAIKGNEATPNAQSAGAFTPPDIDEQLQQKILAQYKADFSLKSTYSQGTLLNPQKSLCPIRMFAGPESFLFVPLNGGEFYKGTQTAAGYSFSPETSPEVGDFYEIVDIFNVYDISALVGAPEKIVTQYNAKNYINIGSLHGIFVPKNQTKGYFAYLVPMRFDVRIFLTDIPANVSSSGELPSEEINFICSNPAIYNPLLQVYSYNFLSMESYYGVLTDR